MEHAEYWAERFTALDDQLYKKSEEYARTLQRQFDRARRTITRDLGYWYGRLAENNGISYAEAKKLLKDDELADFHLTVEEYIKHGREDGLDPAWIKKLENASSKVHISRLEQIQTDLEQTIEDLYFQYETGAEMLLESVTTTSYYHTAYEVAKGTGIGVNLHRLDIDTIKGFLTTPWCKDGNVFSDRIWARKNELTDALTTLLAQNLMTGADPQRAIDQIAERFDVDKRAAGRLIMTETAAISSEARKQCLKDLDVEQFEIVATLDSRTSDTCRRMDGQHFPMSQYKIGFNAPPFHCNCRSTTVPWFDDEFTRKDETRAAREPGDTGYNRVPSNMTYKEWEKEYIKSSSEMSSNQLKISTKDGKVDIEIDEFTPCLRKTEDGSIMQTTISEIHPKKGEFKDWEFDWTKPEREGYRVFALKAQGDSRIQGLISLKEDASNYGMHIGIVESAPFNNRHNKRFVSKEYAGVGPHLFAEAVKQSYESGYGGFVLFESKTGLIDYYKETLGAVQIGSTQNMYIDEQAAAKLFYTYYGEKK